MSRTCYIIIGMRSGSSTVAGVINKLGVFMSGPLLNPAPDNPRGFFELIDIANLNSKHIDWTSPEAQNKINKKKLSTELRKCIDKHFKNITKFAIKDPRIAGLFPIYKEILEDMGIEVKLILVTRSLKHVVKSLIRWRDKTPSEAMNIAKAYARLYFQHQLNYPNSLMVEYPLLVKFPQTHVEVIAQYIDQTEYEGEKIYWFIDASLDHGEDK